MSGRVTSADHVSTQREHHYTWHKRNSAIRNRVRHRLCYAGSSMKLSVHGAALVASVFLLAPPYLSAASSELLTVALQTARPTESTAQETAAVQPAETAELLEERERLLLANQIAEEKLRKELSSAQAELSRLKTETDLNRAKAERELAQKRIEIDKARIAMEEINARQALENTKRQAALDNEMVDIRAARDRAQVEAELATAEFTRRHNTQRAAEVRLAELRARVLEREQEIDADAYAEQRPVYLANPLQPDGSLVLSDRRIPLNGAITMEAADEISERIDYFNNKNKEFPIFIVIDSSPGGSVMAGYRILKSMQSSTAPVYVLVKSFAASMAAAICTLAERSFAYPNAIIVHHQMSTGLLGNLTVQREGLKNMEEWWQRLASPISAKMGVTTEEFIKLMYAHSATGDWKEFADNAVKLKWVDAVIGRCHETALVKNPDADRPSGITMASTAHRLKAPRCRRAGQQRFCRASARSTATIFTIQTATSARSELLRSAAYQVLSSGTQFRGSGVTSNSPAPAGVVASTSFTDPLLTASGGTEVIKRRPLSRCATQVEVESAVARCARSAGDRDRPRYRS
jgi:ATP-dependent Clp protease protease subunit